MTPFSSANLQDQLDAINTSLSKFLSIALASGYGIISTGNESVSPENIKVEVDPETGKLGVAPGLFVTPAGQVGEVTGTIDDLIWPDEPVMYVVLYSNTVETKAVSEYGEDVVVLTDPSFSVAVVDRAGLTALGESGIVVAVLRRSAELDEVDLTNLSYPENRPTAGVTDSSHRVRTRYAPTPTNAHGIGIDQVAANGMSLLRQIHNIGFLALPAGNIYGVPGKLVSMVVVGQAQQSPTGKYVPPGLFYYAMSAYPVARPKVIKDGVDIDFSWEPGTNILNFGLTDPETFLLSFFRVTDIEIQGGDAGTITRFKGTDEAVCVSDGVLVTPADGAVDFSKYKGLALNVDVVVDAEGNYRTVPDVVGYVKPSVSKNVQASFPLTLSEPSQLGFAVVGAGLDGPVPPPSGRMRAVSKDVVGKYRFMYTLVTPAVTSNLMFMPTGFGSYLSLVGDTPGRLLRDGRLVRSGYYNIINGYLYLEARAYVPGASYVFETAAFESRRFQRGYLEVVGTRKAPAGIAATASIRLNAPTTPGDSVTLQFGSGNPAVIKTHGVDFSGVDTQSCLASLAAALAADALFAEKATASASGNLLVLSATAAGTPGNAYSVSVAGTELSSKFSVSQFAGGASYSSSPQDLIGAGLEILQPFQEIPEGTTLRIYVTGDLSQGAENTKYKRLADIPMVSGTHAYEVAVDAAVVANMPNATDYDVSTQFQAELRIQGVDPNGVAVADTITLSECNVAETAEFGNALQMQTTKAVYATVNGIVLSSSSNTGTAKIVFLTQALSRNSSRTRVAEAVLDRERVLRVHDARVLTPTTLNRTADIQGDALMFRLALRDA